MPATRQIWALILAGGEAIACAPLPRVRAAPPCRSSSVPCGGGRSLLEDAVDRALRLSDPERICAIVAQQHQRNGGPESSGLEAPAAAT